MRVLAKHVCHSLGVKSHSPKPNQNIIVLMVARSEVHVFPNKRPISIFPDVDLISFKCQAVEHTSVFYPIVSSTISIRWVIGATRVNC